MRAGVTVLRVPIALVLVALPVAGHSQSPTITRGAFGGSLPQGATSGAFRGTLPQNATVGATRGSLAPSATVGAIGGAFPPGGTGGIIRPLPSAGAVGVLRGSLSADSTVGALPAPVPPGARFGEPGPADLAQGLKSQARIRLNEGDYAPAEDMLKESVAIREQAVGRDHPDVAQALEDNATLLRQWNRQSLATDMETRAKEIRTNLEEVAKPKTPSP